MWLLVENVKSAASVSKTVGQWTLDRKPEVDAEYLVFRKRFDSMTYRRLVGSIEQKGMEGLGKF